MLLGAEGDRSSLAGTRRDQLGHNHKTDFQGPGDSTLCLH